MKTTKTRKKHGIYRSGLEKAFAKEAPRKFFEYEPFHLPYIVPRTYTPDFVHRESGILVECKGFFRVGDTQKYKAIRDTIEKDLDYRELVFVFSDPNKKLRKGSKMTLGQWCEKEGFVYFTVSQMEDLIAYIEQGEDYE